MKYATRSFEWYAAKVTVRPLGIRRFLRFLWFQTGSVVAVRYRVGRKDGGHWPNRWYVRVRNPAGGNDYPAKGDIPDIPLGHHYNIDVIIGFLTDEGGYRCELTLIKDIEAEYGPLVSEHFGGQVSFRAIQQEDVTFRVINIGSVVVAGLLGGLLALIVRALT